MKRNGLGNKAVEGCSPRGAAAPWNSPRPNRVYAKLYVFAHMRTATLGSVSHFPFWWIKEKHESKNYV